MIPLFLIFGLMLLLKSPLLIPYTNPDQGVSFSLGFILIFAFLVGRQTKRLHLPQITGFIIAGILCGPYLLNFLSLADVGDLQLLDGLALSLIALTAGGEMRIDRLRESLSTIGAIVVCQTLFIVAGFLVFGLAAKSVFPFFAILSLRQCLAVSLLLGTLASATSPSTTIAIITETRAKGRYTDLILGAAVVKDFMVIAFFALALSFSKSLLSPGQEFDFGFLAAILKELGGSILIGVMVGGGIILYLKFIRREMTIFILGIAFFTYQISQSYGYHPLLICLVAGFLAENFSAQGEKLILAIEKSSMPVYVVFFAISGASLNLNALKESWVLAFVFVVWRGILKFSATWTGAKISGEDKQFRRLAWSGFISQAGVALGMAVIIQMTFPEWGSTFKALVLAVIAINQIAGPVLLQKLLIKVGEAGKK